MKQMLNNGNLIPGRSKLRLQGLAIQISHESTDDDDDDDSDNGNNDMVISPEEIILPDTMDIANMMELNRDEWDHDEEDDTITNSSDNGIRHKRTRKHSTSTYSSTDSHMRNLRRKLSNGDVTGVKPILVVKVTDSDGRARYESAAQISDDIFGSYTDPVNMKSQLEDCSFGQLTIQPGQLPDDVASKDTSGNTIPGTMEVTIPIPLNTNDRYKIHNAITTEVQSKLGITLPGPFEQVMYVIEKCYVGCGWAAYAYVNSWMSVYQYQYYKMVGVTVHELGHNFGLAHSGGLNGKTYTDHTGLMVRFYFH